MYPAGAAHLSACLGAMGGASMWGPFSPWACARRGWVEAAAQIIQ